MRRLISGSGFGEMGRFLKSHDGFFGLVTKITIGFSSKVVQVNEALLKGNNVVSFASPFKHSIYGRLSGNAQCPFGPFDILFVSSA